MKLIQKETITEKKINTTDGKVFEKTTVHEDVLLHGTPVPLKANLNEDMVIKVWNNADGSEHTFTPEEFYNWVQSKVANDLPYLQVKIEGSHDDGYSYEYDVDIGWYEIDTQSDLSYTLDVYDLFTMTPIFNQDYNNLQEIVVLLTKNLDRSAVIYNPSEPFINRNCRISINHVDVTNCFYRIDEWKITTSETDTSSTLTVEGNYLNERIVTEHLYAVDKQNNCHPLYSRSIRVNPYTETAKQVFYVGKGRHQYDCDLDFPIAKQDGPYFENVTPAESQAYLAGEPKSSLIQEYLSKNNIDAEIVKFYSIIFDVQNNFPWVMTRTITKDSIDEDWFYQTNINEIVRTPYPRCVYLD